jgi:xanthine dehydrogenase accessory factor
LALFHFSDYLVLVRGGGDLGTGVAYRLHRAGFTLMVTDLAQPTCVRRAVSFAEAMYAGRVTVEGATAVRVDDPMLGMAATIMREIPVMVDDRSVLERMRPPIVVDARLAKRNLGTRLRDAPLVIGLGPGFTAGKDCHAVVETNRGHDLGRVYWDGSAEADTGRPEPVHGFTGERVLRAPAEGPFQGRVRIGDLAKAGDVLAVVEGQPIVAAFDGVVRGLIQDGLRVTAGMKVGDLDPRGVREHCFTISDKARAIGGGVLEAILEGIELWRPTATVEEMDAGEP